PGLPPRRHSGVSRLPAASGGSRLRGREFFVNCAGPVKKDPAFLLTPRSGAFGYLPQGLVCRKGYVRQKQPRDKPPAAAPPLADRATTRKAALSGSPRRLRLLAL